METTRSKPSSFHWKAALEQSGHVVLHQRDEEYLVVDSHRPWNAVIASTEDEDVVERLKKAPSNSNSSVVRCEMLYVGDWPPPQAATVAIHALARQHGPRHTRLRVHLTKRDARLVDGLRQFAGESGRCSVEFLGAIPELSEPDIATLIRRGAAVAYSVGWFDDDQVDQTSLKRNAELGLRIPLVFFIHNRNIDTAIDEAADLLDLTKHAGVSFLPACSHPLFGQQHESELPDPFAYCDFLTEAYRRFRFYDDVFEPIASIVDKLRHGGWSAAEARNLPIQYRINCHGAVSEYRQLPWDASPHNPRTSNDTDQRPTLCSECTKCRWLPMCGGCDKTSEATFSVVCEYRKLFLEFFVRQMHERLFAH